VKKKTLIILQKLSISNRRCSFDISIRFPEKKKNCFQHQFDNNVKRFNTVYLKYFW